MQKSSRLEKIELLIAQLEQEVQKLASSRHTELNSVKEVNSIANRDLHDQFEQRILLVDGKHQSQIADLQGEIAYLKELNFSQRLMMEDSMMYIKDLEKKVNATPTLD